ncbi:MAG: PilZ domain-containing protein [Polyangia bacterium]
MTTNKTYDDSDDPVGGAPSTGERRTGIRAKLSVPVMCRYDSVLDFVETQSMNVSETGMFMATETPAAVGSRIDFNFTLADGFSLLRGSAEVMRVVTSGPVNGMGVRFVDLDEANRALIARIVQVNSEEGRNSTMNFDFSRRATITSMPVVSDAAGYSSAGSPAARPAPATGAAAPVAPAAAARPQAPPVVPAPAARPAAVPPIRFDGRAVRIVLNAVTAPYFTQNPLLNVRSGGLFIPAEEDVPLGTVFQVDIVDGAGRPLISGKGKVVAKQDLRVGLRLNEVEKDALVRLRAEVDKVGGSGGGVK